MVLCSSTKKHSAPDQCGRKGEKIMETFLYFLATAVAASGIGYFIGGSSKPAPQPAPAPQPKIFGLSEFERFVGAIPETAKSNPDTLGVVVQAGTGLAVGLLGFEDKVVQETEEAIAERLVAIRKNEERIASLAEEARKVEAAINETRSASQATLVRVGTLSALK